MCFVKFGPRGTVETKGEEIFLPFQFMGVQNLKPDCKVGILISNKNRVDENVTPQSKDYVVIGHVSVDNLAGKDNLRFKTTIEKLTDELDKTNIGSAGTKYYWVYLEYNGRYYISADYSTFTIKKEQSPEEIMREYLVKLYHDTDGDNWRNNTNWLSDLPITQWYGVQQDWFGKDIYKIKLSQNGLKGKIDLQGCTYLASIDCSNNKLVALDVAYCINLDGISCEDNLLVSINVSNCTNLQSLYCYRNKLTDIDVSSCEKLKILDCRQNMIKNRFRLIIRG